MVLNLPESLYAGAGVIWAIGLSLGLFFLSRKFSRLIAGTKKESLDRVLEQLNLDFQKEHESHRQIEKDLADIKNQLPRHLSKIGLVRFNPFTGTGGNQSFSLAILDGENSGLIITSLHSRDGTRLYTKPILKAKGLSDLSKEELSALNQATKNE